MSGKHRTGAAAVRELHELVGRALERAKQGAAAGAGVDHGPEAPCDRTPAFLCGYQQATLEGLAGELCRALALAEGLLPELERPDPPPLREPTEEQRAKVRRILAAKGIAPRPPNPHALELAKRAIARRALERRGRSGGSNGADP